MKQAPAGRLDALTSLRFFAAAIVVLYHCGFPFQFLPLPFRGLMKSGYESVSFFFALSGFVLAYSYFTPKGTDRAFWTNRFARIYPIYLVALLIALPRYLWAVKLGTVTRGDAAVSLVAVPLLVQSWFPSVNIAGAINLPAWSLSVEAFFYALFPLILRVTRAIGPVWMMAIGGAGLIFLQLNGGGLRPVGGYIGPVGGYFPINHLSTFVIGVALGFLFRKTAPGPMRWAFAMLSVLTLLLFGLRDLMPAFVMSRLVIVPIFGALIFTAASCAGRLTFLERPAFVLLGDASYSLYILHKPLYEILDAILKRAHVNLAASIPLTCCYFVGAVAVSVLSYQWIELPARLRILGLSASKPKTVTASPRLTPAESRS